MGGGYPSDMGARDTFMMNSMFFVSVATVSFMYIGRVLSHLVFRNFCLMKSSALAGFSGSS